ncbi:MAG: hypothetical protein DKINENOH_00488 [bacterium]|nr:hypothetical protein [bacterium]
MTRATLLLFSVLLSSAHAQAQEHRQATAYCVLGALQGGSFGGTLELKEFGVQVPYRLYYPDNTKILILGLSGALNESSWLHGFMNLGAPLGDVYTDLRFDSEILSERLNVATMYMDFGLAFYPMERIRRGARIQPFIQGGLGFYIVADNWWVILLMGLTEGDTSVESTQTRATLSDRFDGDLLFSYGGGVDYYFLKNAGLKLAFRKLKMNLPGQKGSLRPLEINLGLTARF